MIAGVSHHLINNAFNITMGLETTPLIVNTGRRINFSSASGTRRVYYYPQVIEQQPLFPKAGCSSTAPRMPDVCLKYSHHLLERGNGDKDLNPP